MPGVTQQVARDGEARFASLHGTMQISMTPAQTANESTLAGKGRKGERGREDEKESPDDAGSVNDGDDEGWVVCG